MDGIFNHILTLSFNFQSCSGMTELGSWTTFQTKNRKKCDSVGHIVETVQMKVIDPKTSKTLGPNEQGELCFKLKNYMLGYFRNQEQTEKMFDNEGI